jgi:hypothetical protein
MECYAMERESIYRRNSKKKIVVEKPKRGRPRNKFIAYKTYWCLSYGGFCDAARKNGKCCEESPIHTMPFPFADFDCQRYVDVPVKFLSQFAEPILIKILSDAFLGLMRKLGAGSNVKFNVQDIASMDNGKYCVSFIVSSGHHENFRERVIEVIV